MSELNTARLRCARERNGLNQITLSRQLKVSPGLAGQWERGLKEPSLGKLKDLSRALQVTVGWLLGMDEPAPLAGPEGIHTTHGTPDRPRHDSPEAILADYQAPIGLRDFAQSQPLVAGLQITPEEWVALSSVDFGEGLTKEGYCMVLMALRTASIQTTRQRVKAKPGRPLVCDDSVTNARHNRS